MAETLQIRSKSETQEKFKRIAEELGINYEDALVTMMSAYDANEHATRIPDKADVISKFQAHQNAQIQLFLASIDDAATMEGQMRTKFEADLKSKDQQIVALQEKQEEARQLIKQAEEDRRRAETAEKATAEVNERIKSIQAENHHLATIVANMGDAAVLKEKVVELEKEIAVLQEKIDAKDQMIETYKSFIDIKNGESK